ncbi:MAG: haloalkane dehalogenase [Gammaproteobacteria bacterium]|nr:haloalkane dehalogenase [Gammaproteobacteria bacterium]
MKILRTPDEHFDNLPDYPFSPNYLTIADTEGGELRMHYLDEGPADGPVVLLLHGQPVWSYLYRFMIPLLVNKGFRVLAPDLVGFGRSDKPTRMEDYTYARHVAWMSDWLTKMDLRNVTVFFQDWGSLIGLRLVAAFPERFSHVVLSNGGMPAGVIRGFVGKFFQWIYPYIKIIEAKELPARFKTNWPAPGFLYWRKYCAQNPNFAITDVMEMTANKALSADELLAYAAPFPDQSYMSGARKFPSLVPVFENEAEVEQNKAAWRVLQEFNKPFMCAFADNDPVTAGADKRFIKQVPGCSGVSHRTIPNAGHFVQQDQPEHCVQAILDITRQNQA